MKNIDGLQRLGSFTVIGDICINDKIIKVQIPALGSADTKMRGTNCIIFFSA